MGFRRSLTVTRFEPGQYVDGVWVEGASEEITIRASVQPASPNDMQSLPEGRRERKSYTLFGNTKLRSVEDNTNPDRVEIDGEQYEIAKSSEWRNGVISHNEAIAQRIEQ